MPYPAPFPVLTTPHREQTYQRFTGVLYTLDYERTRLRAIIAAWDQLLAGGNISYLIKREAEAHRAHFCRRMVKLNVLLKDTKPIV